MNIKTKKCIKKISLRSLLASRKRNIIAIVAIVLTTTLFTSFFTIAMSLNSSYQMYTFRQVGGYSHGSFKKISDEQIKKISSNSKIKATGKRINIGYIDDNAFSKAPSELSYMDDNCAKWSFASADTGRNPQNGNEITMDTYILNLLGIKPELGAKITITFTIGALSENSYKKTDTFTLVGWWEYDEISPVHYLNVSEEYAAKLESEAISNVSEPFTTNLDVMLNSGINIEKQMQQICTDSGYSYSDTTSQNFINFGTNLGYTSEQISQNIDTETIVAIIMFLSLIIFTGYLIIYNIFQISVNGDIQFYGLLKTIGVTAKQLRYVIRRQALFLCAIGIPFGLIIGYIIGTILSPMIIAQSDLASNTSVSNTSPLIFIASALFTLITVLISCSRPAKTASKVSPIEATKYVGIGKLNKKNKITRGAKIHQMALANLGRNKFKTTIVVISLSLSVVLLNVVFTFTNGFNMDKYLEKQSCADFIVSSADYFDFNSSQYYISEEEIALIKENVSTLLSGCGYTLTGFEPLLKSNDEKNLEYLSIEGLDDALFKKLTLVEGNLDDLFSENSNSIAIVVPTDDYGNISNLDSYPAIGSLKSITYIDEASYIDTRTGNICDENTPLEFTKFNITTSHNVEYNICAYVTIPDSISFRYYTQGYYLILPNERLKTDSLQDTIPMFYLFDTPDSETEYDAENYLSNLTTNNSSELMYESKSVLRNEFKNFQNMFIRLGSLLCIIIGLVGILNFFNTMLTDIVSRKKEFAILQAIGMTKKQLKFMLIYEGMFYALFSSILALLLSCIITPLLNTLMENIFWFFTSNFTIIPVILSIPVFALLCIIIPSIIYRHTSKFSLSSQLKDY